MRRMTRAWALWSPVALLCCSVAFGQGGFSFAVVGDAPYNYQEEGEFTAMLERIGREDLAFVIHVGDFKSGSSPCSDPVFRQRRELLDASRRPLIYTPGDNEWTDCHRASAGSHDPLERLRKLRALFFAEGRSLGRKTLPLLRQSEADGKHSAYSENAMWDYGGVLFVTLNVPGSNNNFGRTPEMDREYRQRGEANRTWLARAFRRAEEESLEGVVVAMQADPLFELEPSHPRRTGYGELLAQLAQQARAYGKPVLLIHGDSHRYRHDRPLADPATGRSLANLARLETFGSPVVGWVKVIVDPSHPGLFLPESH